MGYASLTSEQTSQLHAELLIFTDDKQGQRQQCLQAVNHGKKQSLWFATSPVFVISSDYIYADLHGRANNLQQVWFNCMISKSGDHKITDVLNLCFRNKTGILGWRSEKTETVNGYEAKVRNTDLSRYPEKPPLSELSLIFPESPLHLKSSISKKNHSQGYYKNIFK